MVESHTPQTSSNHKTVCIKQYAGYYIYHKGSKTFLKNILSTKNTNNNKIHKWNLRNGIYDILDTAQITNSQKQGGTNPDIKEVVEHS